MKDEIKEILDKLEIVARKHTIEVCDDGNIETMPANVIDELRLNNYSAKLLLDYITNLQEKYKGAILIGKELNKENERLKEENKEWQMIFDTFSKRPYAHRYLEEKKKELENDKIIGLDSEMVYKDYYDYKTRNEKASTYIEHYLIGNILKAENCQRSLKYLLNILQGKSDE